MMRSAWIGYENGGAVDEGELAALLLSSGKKGFLSSIDIAPDWWQPGANRFFSEGYRVISGLLPSYLVGPPATECERTAREASAVADLIRRHGAFRGPVHVLDVPNGYGRHAVAFGELGFLVTGVDINPSYVMRARQVVASKGLAGPIQLGCGDMRSLPVADSSVDVVTNMWTSFGFFEAEEDNVRVLAEWSRVLKPGGLAVMYSDLNPEFVRSGGWDETKRFCLLDRRQLHIREVYDQSDGSVKGVWVVEAHRKHHVRPPFRLRVWTDEEWQWNARRCGLRVEAIYDRLDGVTSAIGSEHVVVLSKPAA